MTTALLASFSWGAAYANHVSPISSDFAYQRDGCQRDTAGLLDWRNGAQAWVYVNNTRNPVLLRGVVLDTKVTKEDLYANHETRGVFGTQNYYINHDVNIYVRPDHGLENLLGTGNMAAHSNDNGVDTTGTVEVEAMTGEWALNNNYGEWRDFYPTLAWPAPGDRVELIGPHVWDCGHWDNGERTEMHPPAWVHVQRARQAGYVFRKDGVPTAAAAHDVYANSNKQLAGIIAEWELTRQETRQNTDVTGGVRSFFLNAPRKPSPDARLVYREIRSPVRMLSNVGRVSVRAFPTVPPWAAINRMGIAVTVDMRGTQPLPGLPDVGYAARWYVGWDRGPTPGFKRVRTRFLKVRCKNDLDSGPGDGEYHLFFRAGNSHSYGFDAGLNACNDGWIFGSPEEVTLSPTPTSEQIVPSNGTLPVEATGYENDDPLPGNWAGRYMANRPLADGTAWVSATTPGGTSNFDVQIETTVLQTYPPVP